MTIARRSGGPLETPGTSFLLATRRLFFPERRLACIASALHPLGSIFYPHCCSFLRPETDHLRPANLSISSDGSLVQSCGPAGHLPRPCQSQTWLIMLHNRKSAPHKLPPCTSCHFECHFCYPQPCSCLVGYDSLKVVHLRSLRSPFHYRFTVYLPATTLSPDRTIFCLGRLRHNVTPIWIVIC
jgi:hypothetical protein